MTLGSFYIFLVDPQPRFDLLEIPSSNHRLRNPPISQSLIPILSAPVTDLNVFRTELNFGILNVEDQPTPLFPEEKNRNQSF